MKTRNIFTKLSLAMTVIAIVLLVSSRSSAAANRTWVSPSGDDNNACTNANPCRTFAGALAKTNAKGEIIVKESGGFGAVTINKSVTINGGGKYAGIQASSGGNGVEIQAGNTDVIVLRGLTIKGLGVGEFGISGSSTFGGVVHVESCAISDFTIDGILMVGTLYVQDTVITECGGIAVDMNDGGRALIEHSRVENNRAGISVGQGARVTVRSTVASGNKGPGFNNFSGTLNLENCVASNNGEGVFASVVPGTNTPTIVVISNSVVTNNQYGLLSAGLNVIYSRGNNTVTGNTVAGINTDIVGPITPLGGS
jgi:hypothetical protein